MFFKTDKITALENTSKGIISIFTETIDKLMKVNNEIESEIDIKQGEIAALTQDVQSLDDIKISNDKIISKVKQIIE